MTDKELHKAGRAASDKELLRIARKAGERAYAPYSRFKVGAALLGRDGKVYTGCNVENSAYPAGICAERVAMSKAISEGCREFESIAVSGNGKKAWPCGMCRQFMFEFAEDMRVISGEGEGDVEVRILKDLLLEGFKL